MNPRFLVLGAFGIIAPLQAFSAEPPSDPKLDAMLQEKDRWTGLKEMLDYADTLSADQAAATVKYIEARNNSETLSEPLSLFVHRWAELDPEAALAEVRHMGNQGALGPLLGEIFTVLAKKDPDAALEQARQLPPGFPRNIAFRPVFIEMARRDPQHALAMAATLPVTAWNDIYYAVFMGWGARDATAATHAALHLPKMNLDMVQAIGLGLGSVKPDAVAAWAETLPVGPVRAMGERAAGEIISQHDPAAAVDYVAKLPPSDSQGTILWDVTVAWGRRDPAAALRRVFQMPPESQRATAIQQILTSWGENNPKAAIEALDALPANAELDVLRAKLLPQWAQFDPGGAADYAGKLPGDYRRRTALTSIATALANTNPRRAMALAVENADPVIKQQTIEQIGGVWVRNDAPGAIDYAKTIVDENARDAYLMTVVRCWFAFDATAAGRWLRALDDKALQARIAGEVAQMWEASDPVGAAEYLQMMPPGPAREAAIDNYAEMRASGDPAKAMEWARQLPQADRKRAITQVMTRWTVEDPVSAAKFISANASDPDCVAMMPFVAGVWARNDVPAALAWIKTFPDETMREFADFSVVDNWASVNRDAAEAWLSGLPAGHARDFVMRRYSESLCFKDPAAAYRWARIIQDTRVRDGAEWEALRDWQRKDKFGANAKVAGSDLSQHEKNELLGIPEPPPQLDSRLPH